MSANKTILTWGIAAVIFAGIAYGVEHKDDIFGNKDRTSSSVVSSENTSGHSTQTVANAETPVETNQLQPKEISISAISKSDAGKSITIKGTIHEMKKSKDGTHTFLTVVDDTDSITVPIFADKKITTEFKVNDQYFFTGIVDVYNDELEVIPQKPEDIEAVLREEEISQATVGQTKTIKATIVTKYDHPDGHVFLNVLLSDTQQEMEVPIFSNLNYDDSQLSINAIIQIEGVVTEYKGKLEVVPQNAADITLLSPGDDNNVSLIKVEQLSEKDRGKMYQVKGYVSDVTEKDGHLFFTFENEEKNQSIQAVLYRADGKEINGRKTKILNASKEHFPIRILAMVDVYKENLELILDKVYNEYDE